MNKRRNSSIFYFMSGTRIGCVGGCVSAGSSRRCWLSGKLRQTSPERTGTNDRARPGALGVRVAGAVGRWPRAPCRALGTAAPMWMWLPDASR